MLNFKEFIAESEYDMITEAGERMTKMKCRVLWTLFHQVSVMTS